MCAKPRGSPLARRNSNFGVPMERGPKVLLILTDEERYRHVHPAGFTLPARDRLAAARMTFDNY